MNYFFGSKVTITEKTLQQNNIPIINKREVYVDKRNMLATTGSGRFYTGTYKNDPVSIKVF
jgi:hypothetical protein